MPKAIPRTSLAALLLPLTLGSLPLITQAAENNGLNAAVTRILERGGIIEPGTAPSTRTAQPAPIARAEAFEARAQASSAVPVDETTNQAIVPGLVLIFADAEAKALSGQNLPPPAALIDALEQATEVPLAFKRAMAMGAFVFEFEQPLTMQAFNTLQRQLEALDVVEALYADLHQQPQRMPVDARYYWGQWGLQPADSYSGTLEKTVTGIDAQSAWDITTGSSDMVIAVIDSGLTDPHPFDPVRVLPGYDFISDAENARDGDGRDTDPTDMGDHQLAGECDDEDSESRSSWHGTKVASILAADGDDGNGMAGVDWRAKLLPVRVLGKCGGRVSDIVEGMMWASGISVPGVPDNPTPARIRNLSLGALNDEDGDEGCNPLYDIAFRILNTHNVMIIASAGNDDDDTALYEPANCFGVLAVSAVGPYGDRAPYSNWNKEGEIFIAAPGGDWKNHGDYALIVATADTGDMEPNGVLQAVYSSGTSMAAPHVSGVASLAWGIDPGQRPDIIAAMMYATAQPFASDSRCETEWPLCGAGIVDAWATVTAAQELKPYSFIMEYYHEELNHYFRTANYDEVSLVRGGHFGDWSETEEIIITWRGPTEVGVLPVCRFYGTPGIGPNSHFYTVDPVECETVKRDPGWTYEGIPFYAKRAAAGHCPFNTSPVYRYYNNGWERNDSNHRYATHLADLSAMQADGWVLEGTAMCVPEIEEE